MMWPGGLHGHHVQGTPTEGSAMIPSPLHGQIPFHSAPTILSRQRASDCGLSPGGSPGFRTGLIFRLLESSFGEREAEGHFGTGEKGVLEPDQFFAGAGFGYYRKGLGGQMLDNVTQGDSSLCWWDSWGSDLSYISAGPLCTAVCRVRKSPSSPKPTTASPLLSQACGKGLPVEEPPASGTSSVDPDRSLLPSPAAQCLGVSAAGRMLRSLHPPPCSSS